MQDHGHDERIFSLKTSRLDLIGLRVATAAQRRSRLASCVGGIRAENRGGQGGVSR
jgi:hypothetical protein